MEKEAIQKAIKDFTHGDLTENAIQLFKSLGYNTSRSNPLQQKNFDYFKSAFPMPETFNAKKAHTGEWEYFDILFQVSNAEISHQNELWDNKRLDNKLIESYLFVVIELKKNEYSRSHLARICRGVNKIFPMPVLVLFRYGKCITLSVIDRRINKRRNEKDVLEKVTLIKDIAIDNPHRAHIEILFDFSFTELSKKYSITNFIELHDAWQKTLDTKELNKRFYRELSYWYFWAMQKVVFPNPHGEDDHNAKSLIRLLTRLLFVWFVKEKGLVPRQLFDEPFVAGLLKTFDPRNEYGIKNQMKGSAYYRAVLQNLFFATLNQERGHRGFRKKGQNQNATTLFRYEDYFTDVRKFKTLLETIPFMNGGLFECLDKPDPVKKGREGGAIINYEDGFSDRPDNVLCVPDYLFFAKDEHADISAELDDPRLRDVKVDGLLTILNKYKFTVAENTPIEEDIALDPELLGRVFENLLASYNPETKTTARKQTGSFYTPREIVDYMADISIKAYLQQKLTCEAGMGDAEADTALELLIGYYESEHIFNDEQVQVLINAIDTCKILDPACGSGAFPMGVLHKLTFILGKLDPHNKLWARKQREKAEKIDDADIRDKTIADIEAAFERNELDYGRKLYLIENCIFGVDIQSIAIQISKLRFFISLIVEQKADGSRDNFGVRPLPNLETKFVAANTLIGLEKPPEATALFNEHKELDACKAKLKDVRHRLFSAKTPATKNKLRAEDKAIRRQIAQILINDRWSDESAKQIAAWEIDDQNASSPWFDAEWMFGVDGGFDVVIGNPPYVSALDFLRIYGQKIRDILNSNFESASGAYDYYVLFIEMGIKLCRNNGLLCLITPNKYLSANYAKKLREFILSSITLKVITDISKIHIFENVAVYPIISLFSKVGNGNKNLLSYLPFIENATFNVNDFFCANISYDLLSVLPDNIWGFVLSRHASILNKILQDTISLSKLGEINASTTAAEADCYSNLISEEKNKNTKKIINTGTIDPYLSLWGIEKMTNKRKSYLKPYLNLDNKIIAERRINLYNIPKIIFAKLSKRTEAFLDINGDYASINTNCFYKPSHNLSLKYVCAFVNSRLFMFMYDLLFGALRMSGGYYQFQAPQLRVMPIKIANIKVQECIVNIVDQILAAKAANPQADTSAPERQIDNLVYRLYNLTWEEVKVVEPDFSLSRAEYEGIEV